jgi:hypothetical protein
LRKLRTLGGGIYIWTVNDPDEMQRLVTMGVNGIVTDKPDLLYDVCRELAEARQPVMREARLSSGRFVYIPGALRQT